MNKVLDSFNNLSIKGKIVTLIIVMVVLLIFTRILITSNKNNNEYTASIDYNDITIEELMKNYTEDYENRDIYIELKEIIDKLNSIYSTFDNNYENYYYILDSNYASKIGKSEFSNKMNSIFQKVNSEQDKYEIKTYRENNRYDTYIVEICSNETVGYIGIILDATTLTYSIFYIG